MRRRKEKWKFYPRAIHHIYARCKDHGVLFYSVKDRLVYYTLAAVNSKKKNVRVLAGSLMFTHLHQSVVAQSAEDISCYMRNTNSSFSRLYNSNYNRSEGALFDRPLGQSTKKTTKEQRSNIIYVYNNHVEKGLCLDAMEERWSFLAYAFSDHPFSKAIDLKDLSKSMSKAINLVNRRVRKKKSIEYVDLDRILPLLTAEETEQFIDYVISRYAWIDFSSALLHFDSPEGMVTAINSTTGGEYEINEDYTSQKDTGFVELLRFARRKGFLDDIYRMSAKERNEHMLSARLKTTASDDQIRRFFHSDFRRYGR